MSKNGYDMICLAPALCMEKCPKQKGFRRWRLYAGWQSSMRCSRLTYTALERWFAAGNDAAEVPFRMFLRSTNIQQNSTGCGCILL